MTRLSSTSEKWSSRANLHPCQTYWVSAQNELGLVQLHPGTSITNLSCVGMKGITENGFILASPEPPRLTSSVFPSEHFCSSSKCGNSVILTKLALVTLCHLSEIVFFPWQAGWTAREPRVTNFQILDREHQDVHPIFHGECNQKYHCLDPIFLREFLTLVKRFLV